jgi:hypothetical protein
MNKECGRGWSAGGWGRWLTGCLGLLAWLIAGTGQGKELEAWGFDLVPEETADAQDPEPPHARPGEPLLEPAPEPPPRPRLRTPACQRLEPATAALVRAAVEAAGLGDEADRDRASRVRLAGFLPKLEAGVSMDVGDRQDFRYEVGSPRVDQLQVDDGWSWDVGLSLDLSGAAYRSEELQAAREGVRRARERRELALEVIRLQHARRRLLLGGLPAAGSEDGAQLEELTDLLDAWTAGRFADVLCRPRVGR